MFEFFSQFIQCKNQVMLTVKASGESGRPGAFATLLNRFICHFICFSHHSSVKTNASPMQSVQRITKKSTLNQP
jgi:hypothetical protein